MSTTSPTAELSALGVSIWLDDLSRDRIKSGSLEALISDRNVVGVTTNPTIFASALAKGETYDAQVAELAKAGKSVLVLEKRHVLGGAAVSEELYPGFTFSVASYVVSLFRPHIIRELQLEKHGLCRAQGEDEVHRLKLTVCEVGGKLGQPLRIPVKR